MLLRRSAKKSCPPISKFVAARAPPNSPRPALPACPGAWAGSPVRARRGPRPQICVCRARARGARGTISSSPRPEVCSPPPSPSLPLSRTPTAPRVGARRGSPHCQGRQGTCSCLPWRAGGRGRASESPRDIRRGSSPLSALSLFSFSPARPDRCRGDPRPLGARQGLPRVDHDPAQGSDPAEARPMRRGTRPYLLFFLPLPFPLASVGRA